METNIKSFDAIDLTPIDEQLNKEALEQQLAIEREEEEKFRLNLNSRRDERHFAFTLLYALDRSDYSIPIEDMIDIFEQQFELVDAQKLFAVSLVQGAIEHRDALDEQIKKHLNNWRIERLGCCTLLILRLALWELQQPNAINSIVINEAIELAHQFAEKDAYRFINGILDKMCKDSNTSPDIATAIQ